MIKFFGGMSAGFCSLTVLLGCILFSSSVSAAIDAYEFPDKATEARYHQLIDELRCPQCLNTNLAGSDAMIAQDLRREVHEMVLAGYGDDEILEFMYQRYGDFILYSPRVTSRTWLLWGGPFLLLLLGGFLLVRRIQGGSPSAPAEVDEERLKSLLTMGDSENSNGKKT